MKYIVIIVSSIVLNTLLHELIHYIVAKYILKIDVTKLHFGTGHFAIPIGKVVEISPFFFGGYVEVRLSELIKKHCIYIILFFESAPIINFIVSLISFYFVNGTAGFILSLTGICVFITSNMPFNDSDLVMMVKILKEKIYDIT